MRKVLLSLIAMVMMLFSSSMLVMAETEYLNYGNWVGYQNADGTFTVAGCRSLDEYVRDGILTIPYEIEGMTVTKVRGYEGTLGSDSSKCILSQSCSLGSGKWNYFRLFSNLFRTGFILYKRSDCFFPV